MAEHPRRKLPRTVDTRLSREYYREIPREHPRPKPNRKNGARLPKLRDVADSQTMRALSHPVRIALIEALTLGGAMTATEVGERIGESPTTCSFHLRQLARYGFIEEAGGGKGRARPWRAAAIGMSFPANPEDPETSLASSAVLSLWRQRVLGRH